MKKTILLITPIILFVYSCGMSPDYNLAYPTPPENAQLEDVFPAEIDGEKGIVENPSYGGINMNYGDVGSIYVVRLENNEEAQSFFQNNLVDEFKDLSSNFSGNINGQFYAKAHSKTKRMFGWINKNYCFVLKASDKEGLETLVNAFKFISK
jgi:hypothetical protein